MGKGLMECRKRGLSREEFRQSCQEEFLSQSVRVWTEGLRRRGCLAGLRSGAEPKRGRNRGEVELRRRKKKRTRGGGKKPR